MASEHDIIVREHLKVSDDLGMKRVVLYDENGTALASFTVAGNVGVKDSGDVRINPAKEDGNLALIKAKTDNLDLATTALRDALRGTNSKTLSDLVTLLAAGLPAALVSGRLDVNVGAAAARSRTVDSISAVDQTDALMNGLTALTPKFAPIAAATSGNNTLITNPNAGKKLRVLALAVIAGVAGDIYFTSDAGGTVIFGGSTNKIKLAANGGFILPYNPKGWFETSADHDLVMNASNTGPYSGGLTYVEV